MGPLRDEVMNMAVPRVERPAASGSRYLIVTADDFGLHESVNDAVEQASDAGILTAASLMISAPAAADAMDGRRLLRPKYRKSPAATATWIRGWWAEASQFSPIPG
jgi:hypothetical protein